MPEHHLLAIPLPNGTARGGAGKISVFFSPRLVEAGPNGTLQDYPWRDWPAVVTDANFGVRFLLDGNAVPASMVTVTSAPADPAVWAAVFGDPQNVAVAPWQFTDRTETPFPATYSPAAVSNSAFNAYAEVAVKHPSIPPTASEIGQLASVRTLLGPNLDAAREFMKPLEPVAGPATEGPSQEFHSVITNLAAHPHLLRLLGLVVDYEIGLPPAGAPGAVAVATNYGTFFQAATGPARSVRFATRVDASFRPLPNVDARLRDQDDGYLPLAETDADYDITSLDPLLAAQRLLGFRQHRGANGVESPLPALREQGISVIRNNMDKVLANKFRRQFAIEDEIQVQLANPANPPVVLFAEDITEGHRYDAKLSSETSWRSLFDRSAPDGYVFPADDALEVLPENDEGWQGFMLMTEAEQILKERGGEQKGLIDLTPQRVHDSIFRWTGWSAATRMPGRMLDGEAGEVRDQPENLPAASDPVQFGVEYRPVPGSLPTLRYGQTYDMRARCVDFAGNSRSVEEPNPPNAQLTETFGRLQPVEPPTVIRRSPKPSPGVGDNPRTIVIKSDYWDQPDDEIESADRLFFPPRLSQHRVELHDEPRGGVAAGAYNFLATRDALDLASQTVEDPRTGELVAGELVLDEIEPGPMRPRADYLIDPSVAGVALANLPGSEDTIVVPYANRWPNLRAVRLDVRAGDRGPRVFSPRSPTSARVWLPKACVATIEYSSSLNPFRLDHFKLWHELSDDERDELEQHIIAGRHWMISPRDKITLVHAVRQPLLAPELQPVAAVRCELGSYAAFFTGCSTMDRKSTQRLTLEASWTDPVDNLFEDAPGTVTTQAVMARLPVPIEVPSQEGEPGINDASDGLLTFADLELNMHDTKRHQVDVTAEAFTRFGRYFTEEAEVSFELGDTITIDARGVVAGEFSATQDETSLRAGVDFTLDGARGEITRLGGGAIAERSEIQVRFIPRPVSRHSSENGDEGVVSVLVKNCAPPLPPVVAEVLPAFERKFSESEDEVTVTHNGQIVRVYIERPWYSTGQGEELGVLIDKVTVAGEVPEATRVGRDPVLGRPGSDFHVGRNNFARAITTTELIDGAHDVAGHEVFFDDERQLWAADIDLAADLGYRPFVSLLLARFQPESIEGAHLSSTVRVDPIRLGASRETTIQSPIDGFLPVTVTGYDAVSADDEHNTISVTLQRANPEIANEDLRWEADAMPIVLTRQETLNGTQWSGEIPLPATTDELRVLIEDVEPSAGPIDVSMGANQMVAFVETVAIPASWTL